MNIGLRVLPIMSIHFINSVAGPTSAIYRISDIPLEHVL